ncbi:helix-turn-helix domain-containing protein [Candidatus Neomarinimicrobiota bacterium]
MPKQRQKYCAYCGSSLEKLYSVESVADLLDCGKDTVRGWIRDRKIGYSKIGRMVRIPQSEIDKIITRRPSIDNLVTETLRRS